MAAPFDSPPTRVASFRPSPLARPAELIDLIVADLEALEPGLSLVERGLDLGERGTIEILARDAFGRAVIVVPSLEPDPPIAPALDRCAWLASHAPIVARLFAGRALDVAAAPRVVLVAPSFSPATRRLAALCGDKGATLVEWRHVRAGEVHGLVLDRGEANARPAAATAPLAEPAAPRAAAPAATPGFVAPPPTPAVGPASSPRPSASVATRPAPSAAPAESVAVAAPPAEEGVRLYAKARERITRIDPRIEPVETEDRGDFLFLHKTLVELRRTSDALWLRIPPAESAVPVRSERDLDRELHAVIEKFFRLYLSGRTDAPRSEPKSATSVDRSALSPAKLTEEELREFYRLENGSKS
jgi:hypothetical protein